MKKIIFTIFLVLPVMTSVVYAAGDVAAGKEKSDICKGCHGVEGNSPDGEIPSLAGQHADYLTKQIRAFQTGEKRVNDIMQGMVASLTEQDILDIAVYFSTQKQAPTAPDVGEDVSTRQRRAIEEHALLVKEKRLDAALVDGEEKAAVCTGCHGTDGNNPVSEFPTLAGQHATYLAKQIRDFKSGKYRFNDIMESMVVSLTEQDITDITVFFSAQKAIAVGSDADEETLAAGKKIFNGGNSKRHVTACAGCHGANAAGNEPAKFPALAGQHTDYIYKQLMDFKTGQRHNDMNKMMQNIAENMSFKDIKAVSAYIATLEP